MGTNRPGSGISVCWPVLQRDEGKGSPLWSQTKLLLVNGISLE